MLGHRFSDPALLEEALVHPSYAAEKPGVAAQNQRLEFLGDAVLQLVVSDMLFRCHPDWQEGDLSKLRAALCKQGALVRLAEVLHLGDFLHLGRGEEQSGGRKRASNLADAFEAVIGAIYLDGGIAPVEALLDNHLSDLIPRGEELLRGENAKGALQELTQRTHQTTPEYSLLAVEGPDHQPIFRVAVSVCLTQLAVGEGRTRKAAEKAAALAALKALAAAGNSDCGQNPTTCRAQT